MSAPTRPRADRLPHPPMLAAFPFSLGLRVLAPGDIRATQRQLDDFRQRYAHAGDPLADDVVAMMRRLPAGQGRQLFETALEEGIDALADPPPELAAFFAQVDAVPYWVDQDQLDLAARATMRTGLWGLLAALPSFALMGGYLASRADKALVATGDLQVKAPRRLVETASWWIEITSPGGTDRGAAGFTNALRVRVMHAHVRAAMNRNPDWDHADWDAPVNQIHTAGTLTLFSMAGMVGCQALGLRFSARERAAIYHLWRYVGWLMGVDPDLLPTNETDTWRLFWVEAATEFRPDQDSYRLGQALLHAIAPTIIPGTGPLARTAGRLLTTYLASYSRLILGSGNAEILGLPASTTGQTAVIITAIVNRALEFLRMLVPGATSTATRFGQRSRTTAITSMIRRQRPDRTYSHHDPLNATSATGEPPR